MIEDPKAFYEKFWPGGSLESTQSYERARDPRINRVIMAVTPLIIERNHIIQFLNECDADTPVGDIISEIPEEYSKYDRPEMTIKDLRAALNDEVTLLWSHITG